MNDRPKFCDLQAHTRLRAPCGTEIEVYLLAGTRTTFVINRLSKDAHPDYATFYKLCKRGLPEASFGIGPQYLATHTVIDEQHPMGPFESDDW